MPLPENVGQEDRGFRAHTELNEKIERVLRTNSASKLRGPALAGQFLDGASYEVEESALCDNVT